MKKLTKNELRMVSGAGDVSDRRLSDVSDGPSDHGDAAMKNGAGAGQTDQALSDVADRGPSDVSDRITNL